MTPAWLAFLAGAVVALIIGIPVLVVSFWPRKPKGGEFKPSRKDRDKGPSHLAGGLEHLALADLLQFLAQGGHSGTLHITSGRRAGIIRLVQGLVTHAEFRRERDLPAMFHLLSLEIGDFHFRFEPPPPEHVRGREVVDILMLWLSAREDFK